MPASFGKLQRIGVMGFEDQASISAFRNALLYCPDSGAVCR